MSEHSKVAFPRDLQKRLRGTGVVAVLVIEDVEAAVPVARALVDAGVDAMELAIRTPASMAALERIAVQVPEMLAGVGTVLEPAQVLEAKRRGATFLVTPGTNRRVLDAAAEAGIPIAPGISVPSDIETALEYGCRILKLFPAVPMGGLAYLRAINAPYAHLGLEYIPLGGISSSDCSDWIAEKTVIAVGGSWIAPRDRIAARDWTAIGRAAAQAAATCKREILHG